MLKEVYGVYIPQHLQKIDTRGIKNRAFNLAIYELVHITYMKLDLFYSQLISNHLFTMDYTPQINISQ
jgi:hypothetical protein